MFRKISYTVMIAAVLVSWGAMLNIAYSADRSASFDNRKALIAAAIEKNKENLVSPAAASLSAKSSNPSDISSLPRVKHRPKTPVQH